MLVIVIVDSYQWRFTEREREKERRLSAKRQKV